MAAALLTEPQFGVGLVREYSLSPSTVFKALKAWQRLGLIEECEPPSLYASIVRSDAVWYVPTVLGREVLQEALDRREARLLAIALANREPDGLGST